jgi:hypothetical protein
VKEKLRDLVPWVEKLLVTLAEANDDNDLEEAERRSQLEKSVPSLASLPSPLISVIDRWEMSEHELWHCWKRERLCASSIKRKTPGKSSRL